RQLVAKIVQDLAHVALPDMEPKLIGKAINLMLTPLPQQKRKRKWTHESDEAEAEEAEDQAPANEKPQRVSTDPEKDSGALGGLGAALDSAVAEAEDGPQSMSS